MKIRCIDTQSDLAISPSHVRALVEAIFEMQGGQSGEVTLHFVDCNTIASLHGHYFDDPTPTDCISFPIDSPKAPPMDSSPSVLGEVFICPAMAKTYGEKWNLDPYRETSLYIIHSILHLLGYKDGKEDGEEMRREEMRCMAHLDKKKLQLAACTSP